MIPYIVSCILRDVSYVAMSKTRFYLRTQSGKYIKAAVLSEPEKYTLVSKMRRATNLKSEATAERLRDRLSKRGWNNLIIVEIIQ